MKYVKHWRPIVLLDADFKVLSKVLANRIQSTLGSLIHENQTGFVKSRLITENLRKFLDIIEYAELKNIPGVLISIDFEKAFDKIEYQAVYKAMAWFNFGENLIKMVKVLFEDFHMCVLNNGFRSRPFSATKGLFQGNPIAPYLFIIVMEVLAVKIRANSKIKGLKIKNQEVLLALFADDLGLILDNDQRSWNKVVHTFSWFERNTGMSINYEKTVVYRLGSLRNTQARFYSQRKMIWSDKPLKVLGVTLTSNKEELIRLNYDSIFEKIEALTKIWLQRGLSFFGKIAIVNTLVASQFNYKLAVLPKLPPEYVKKFYKIVLNFVWNNRAPKISKHIVTSLKEDGGAGMVNLEKRELALKLKWVIHLEKIPDLKELVFEMINNPIGDLIWQANLDKKYKKQLVMNNEFWRDILFDWMDIANVQPQNLTEIRRQVLWFNSRICIDNSFIYYPHWHEAGIALVADILDEEGNFLTYQDLVEKMGKQIPFTEYLGIKQAIQNSWKHIMNIKEEKGKTHLYEELKTCLNVSKKIYSMLNSNSELLRNKCEKLNKECDTHYEIEEMIKMTRDINKTTICVKLRSFQYRMLMNAIVTKTRLYRYNITQNNRCTFCEIDRESIKHLFFECPHSQILWRYVEDRYKCTLTYSMIVTNSAIINPKHPLNTVILIVKYYIYSTKCKQQRVSVTGCKNFIVNYINIEESLAKDTNKLDLHKNKWSELL